MLMSDHHTDWNITIQGEGWKTVVVKDGEDISSQIRSIELHVDVEDHLTLITVEYVTDGRVEINGQTMVQGVWRVNE